MSGVISGVFTLLLTFVFVAIVLWAYSRRNKDTFEKMARLPLDDDKPLNKQPNQTWGK